MRRPPAGWAVLLAPLVAAGLTPGRSAGLGNLRPRAFAAAGRFPRTSGRGRRPCR
jgi:hypothetical protein